MSTKHVVVVQRRGGFFTQLIGLIVMAGLSIGFMGAFFAWPMFIHGWPLAGRIVLQVAWSLLLLAIFIARVRYLARKHAAETAAPQGKHHRGAGKHAAPGGPDTPHPAVKAEPGPRDYTLPDGTPAGDYWLTGEQHSHF